MFAVKASGDFSAVQLVINHLKTVTGMHIFYEIPGITSKF
jgi:hypothetical protein